MQKPQQDPSDPATGENPEEDVIDPLVIEEERLAANDELWAQIRAYQRLADATETVQLAATMAPREVVFEPSLLVDRALALQAEVEAGLIRQRKALVELMSYDTLSSLLKVLGVDDWKEMVDPYDVHLLNPVIGPVLHRIRQMAPTDYLKEAEEWRITDILTEADSRTTLPRPFLPCSLEEALRYAGNAPDVALEVLEKTYEDCLILAIPFNDDGEAFKYLKTLPLDEQLKKLKSARTKELPPIAPIGEPPEIPIGGMIDRAESSQADEIASIYTEEGLADLVEVFHPFWQEHGTSYEKAHKTKAKRSKDAGHTGPSKRDRPLWTKRFEAFIASKPFKEFLQLEPRLQSKPSYETAVADFLKGYNKDGTKSPSAKKKTKIFLMRLFNYRNKNMTPSELKGFQITLDNAHIKTIPDDLIKECHSKLNAKLDGADPTRQKKS